MLTQTQPISFEEFCDWYPDDGKRYELIEGEIIEMLPTGTHEDISGFLVAELNLEIRRHQLPYSIPRTCLVKPSQPRSGYQPDVTLINRNLLKNEPQWSQASVLKNGETIPLVIEVVSTNWRDDYGHKFIEYEAMGISEYWIVDYRGLGGVRYIGQPKQPTITVCQLVDGEYQMQCLRGNQFLESRVFPELQLSTTTIFEAGS
jgi:Uma2 family endonuclease